MKYEITFILVVILLLGTLIGLFENFADNNFEARKVESEKDIKLQINKLFKDQTKFVCADFRDNKLDTLRLDLSRFPINKLIKNRYNHDSIRFEQEKNFIYKNLEVIDVYDLEILWCLNLKAKIWDISVLEKLTDTIYAQYSYVPLAVGYGNLRTKKLEENRIPVIEFLQSQFEYIIDSKVEIQENFNPTNLYKMTDFKSIKNRYFFVIKQIPILLGKSFLSQLEYREKVIQQIELDSIVGISCIHNKYYKTYYAQTEKSYYNISFNKKQYFNDYSNFLKFGRLLVIAFSLIISICSFYPLKRYLKIDSNNLPIDNLNQSSDYNFIVNICSSIKFINPYDSKLINMSNDILSSAIANRNNKRKIKKLKNKAIKILNLKNPLSKKY